MSYYFYKYHLINIDNNTFSNNFSSGSLIKKNLFKMTEFGDDMGNFDNNETVEDIIKKNKILDKKEMNANKKRKAEDHPLVVTLNKINRDEKKSKKNEPVFGSISGKIIEKKEEEEKKKISFENVAIDCDLYRTHKNVPELVNAYCEKCGSQLKKTTAMGGFSIGKSLLVCSNHQNVSGFHTIVEEGDKLDIRYNELTLFGSTDNQIQFLTDLYTKANATIIKLESRIKNLEANKTFKKQPVVVDGKTYY